MASLFSVNAAGANLLYGFKCILPLNYFFLEKIRYYCIVFSISFKLVTIRALVCYNPPFSSLKTGTAIYGCIGCIYGAGPDSLCLTFTSFFHTHTHTHTIHNMCHTIPHSQLFISLTPPDCSEEAGHSTDGGHQLEKKNKVDEFLKILYGAANKKWKPSNSKKRWSKVIIVSCRSCIEGGINCWVGTTVYNRQVVHQWVDATSLLWLNVWNQSGLCVKNVIVDSTKIE